MLKNEMKDELLACCKRLKLSRNLVDNGALVEADSKEEYLLRLLTLEVEHREKGRRDRLLKAAGFYGWKTFENYRFDDVKLPSGVTPEYLTRVGFVEEKKNLILYGNVVNITQRESRLSPKREPQFSRNRATYIQK